MSSTQETNTKTNAKKYVSKKISQSKNDEKIEDETYKVLTQKEHVLERSGMWIGSVQNVDTSMWIFNDETEKIENKVISYNGGLYKLFCELIENAMDHIKRMYKSDEPKKHLVTNIQVNINKETGYISATNDGDGIEVRIVAGQNMYAPQLLFTEMMSGTNFEFKNEKDGKKSTREGAGMNGLGIKLAIIWSKHAIIETVCLKYGKKYIQHIHNNCSIIDPPMITDLQDKKQKPYTKVSFLPDYTRFGLPNGLPDDMYYLMKKRTYEIAMLCNNLNTPDAKKVKVYWNDKMVPLKTMKEYIELYPLISQTFNEIPTLLEKKEGKSKADDETIDIQSNNWEYSITLSPTESFQQISFVNGINTKNGGEHVSFVMDKIISKLKKYVMDKKGIDVKPSFLKSKLMLFLRVNIENPELLGQTKDELTTKILAKNNPYNFATDAFIEKIAIKLGILKYCQNYNSINLNEKQINLQKISDGKKSAKINYEDLFGPYNPANYAGDKKRSIECTLILCEGNSAGAGIKSGLSEKDTDFIGYYCLRGKLKNVRDATETKETAEKKCVIKDIKTILGLKTGKEYSDWETVAKELNYGKLMILTDADLDGSHIKGLIMNLFEAKWPSLLKLDGFITSMLTPILTATKGKTKEMFYYQEEYDKWWETLPENEKKTWKIKYYKGLATSDAKDFKQYFKENKVIDYYCASDRCFDAIDMLFRKSRVEERKQLINNYNRKSILNSQVNKVSYEDFIKHDLIHFSNHDCERSISNVMDGLKTSKRKILYSAFKRNLVDEIKIFQFSGYIAEHSAYHHGDASLNKTIIDMAQNYVGSNNINLLRPLGQFGTRTMNGDDAGQPRYIYTALTKKITRAIFKKEDDEILNYLIDDGQKIEPEYYLPIIPMALINRSEGIGTGYSSVIPSFNPLQIVDYMKQKLLNTYHEDSFPEFVPFYRGFLGTVKKIEEQKFLILGNYERKNDTQILITELPIDTHVDDYVKLFLQKFTETNDNITKSKKVNVDDDNSSVKSKNSISKKIQQSNEPILRDVYSKCTDKIINILLTFNSKDVLDNLLETRPKKEPYLNEFEKLFKLSKTQTITNMYFYNAELQLQKYESIQEIINYFMEKRINGYIARKKYLLEFLKNIKDKLLNQKRYIEENIAGTIDLREYEDDIETNEMLQNKNYVKINDSFDYLTNMPMKSLNQSKVEKLKEDYNTAVKKYDELFNLTEKDLWLKDLDEFESAYNEFLNSNDEDEIIDEKIDNEEDDQNNTRKKRKTTVKRKPVAKK